MGKDTFVFLGWQRFGRFLWLPLSTCRYDADSVSVGGGFWRILWRQAFFVTEADFAEEIFTVVVLEANGAGEWVT